MAHDLNASASSNELRSAGDCDCSLIFSCVFLPSGVVHTKSNLRMGQILVSIWRMKVTRFSEMHKESKRSLPGAVVFRANINHCVITRHIVATQTSS